MAVITKVTMSQIRSELEAALRQIEKKHGVKMNVGNGRYTSSTAHFKVLIAGNAAANTAREGIAAAELASRKTWLGIEPGSKFYFKGLEYKVTGYNNRAQKYKVNADRVVDGQPFRFPLELVQTLIKK